MYIANQGSSLGSIPTEMTCPNCKRLGRFIPIQTDILAFRGETFTPENPGQPNMLFGVRQCPGNSCRCVVFVIFGDNEILSSFPPVQIPFDSSGIPPLIVAAFSEAIGCHANGYYIAAAMLVRKTLEVLCELNGATGQSLHARIEAMSAKVILPLPLLASLHQLRLLGNDAAHVESREYNTISKTELSLAIAVTKEILKAVYQFNDLLAQFEALKKAPDAISGPA